MAKVISQLSEQELRKEGWIALVKRLGVSGATRFLLQYESGFGDYTKERRKIFADKSVQDIVTDLQTRK